MYRLLWIIIILSVSWWVHLKAEEGIMRTLASIRTKERLLMGDLPEATWSMVLDADGKVLRDNRYDPGDRNLATMDAIRDLITRVNLSDLTGELSLNDTLYIYAARRVGTETHLWFVPYDTNMGSPWTLT
jgi:hypothetical protein